ncbi:hypothetical protein DK750_21300 [Salmonella enterica subsp. enterica serovar Rovaniemi]|uniref:HIRAN domain-containing protein n=1 Tax=Salmonella enterica subsp. enterica serovar Agbeni TaxID=1967642 RepID=A0A5X8MSI6_SALET|nr:hypothetical protein [Salmonella enterica subsp. enterica serovar Agbeni]EBU7767332.1 hypothetical protein [Salmonella enterica subsp. enterica serovar Rovaniemi]ECB0429274.1 hypothetical protein [Salmonella enterica subsp. enterica serovar Agbeni]EGC2275114.1 hypothetical protein [Salmonella enterica subsp. enterica serovar Agbeni]EHW4298430.1 HIRAN domain-containing protein [Salmonella enterica subsp. enterica serovar Agbeni]
MRYSCEIAGLHAENKDGTERKKIVRKYLGQDRGKNVQIALIREKDNQYDKNAIAAYVVIDSILRGKALLIGYLDRETAEEVSYFLDSGGVIGDVQIERVWIPHLSHVTPAVHISFDASWSEEDVEYLEEQKDCGEEEQRTTPIEHRDSNQEQSKEPAYRLAYIWLVVIILIVWGLTRI